MYRYCHKLDDKYMMMLRMIIMIIMVDGEDIGDDDGKSGHDGNVDD